MKKSLPILWALCLALLATGCLAKPATNVTTQPSPSPQHTGQLTVMASIHIMAEFAQKIGGEHVQVTSMVSPGVHAHSWEPDTTDITNLESADVLIYNGAGMEHWVDKVAKSLENKELILIEASKGIELLESTAHVHGELNQQGQEDLHDPHVWLNPMNAKKQLFTIKEAFIQVDPDHANEYEQNYQQHAKAMDELDQQFRDTLAPLPRKQIIVAHQAFGYLCEQYGLEQIPIEGVFAESEPDPARMADILRFAKKHDVTTIFFEQTASDKVAQTIADQLDARTDVLSPIESLTDKQLANGDDYISIMQQNLQALAKALAK